MLVSDVGRIINKFVGWINSTWSYFVVWRLEAGGGKGRDNYNSEIERFRIELNNKWVVVLDVTT